MPALQPFPLTRSTRVAYQLYAQREWFDVDAPYQHDETWTPEQQSHMIYSLMRAVPVPAVVVNRRPLGFDGPSTATYGVIDGKHRLNAVIAWFDGALSVPANWFHPHELTVTNTAYVTFRDLTQSAQTYLQLNMAVDVIECSLSTIDDEKHIFDLLNGNHVDNCYLVVAP